MKRGREWRVRVVLHQSPLQQPVETQRRRFGGKKR
jgi:hypothetical protein